MRDAPGSATGSPARVRAVGRDRPPRVDWVMGDGTIVTFTSTGTPYQDGYGDAKSPHCSHRYARSSAGLAGGAYSVTATSYWTVYLGRRGGQRSDRRRLHRGGAGPDRRAAGPRLRLISTSAPIERGR
jgi:hypothetical protein